MKPLKFTETILRDGHQSHIATRMSFEEMLPGLAMLDEVGYHSLEVWGGATFDVCLRYLDENPWERLRKIRKQVKNTKLQMLLRGQNLLGYKHYPDDIVDRFIAKSVDNGIDIIRIFDALNDLRNIERSVMATNKEGAHSQCAIAYTTSPVHTLEYYAKLAKDMASMGADSICIKDMAGILTPLAGTELIERLKRDVTIPIELHGHCTSGICEMTYLKAAEAGVDILDTSLSPFAGGTAQPATESQYAMLKSVRSVSPLNEASLNEASKYFRTIKDKHMSEGTFNPKVMVPEPKILSYQVPGGMLSNLLSQLKDQGVEDKYDQVLEEIPKVRKELGYPPLVTPLSQMVGTQSVFNVLTGERYKVVPKEIKAYFRGEYGLSPAPMDGEVKKKVIGDTIPSIGRPADTLPPMFEEIKTRLKGITNDEEMCLAYALFPEYTKAFLEKQGEASSVIYLEIIT